MRNGYKSVYPNSHGVPCADAALQCVEAVTSVPQQEHVPGWQEACGRGSAHDPGPGTWGTLGLAILTTGSTRGVPQLVAQLLQATASPRPPYPDITRATVLEFLHALVLITRHKEAAGLWDDSLTDLQETLVDCLQVRATPIGCVFLPCLFPAASASNAVHRGLLVRRECALAS